MTHANLYVIFFRIYVIGSVFDYFAGDAFVAGAWQAVSHITRP